LELQTDASYQGLVAVLMLVKEGVLKPIAYASKKLTETEERYHINELEFMALWWALDKFRHHVYGRNCIVKTDSSVIKWVCERAEATKNRRMLKWLMDVRDYDITVKHIKGTSNAIADALSRNPVDADLDAYIVAIIPVGYEQHADDDIRALVFTTQEIGHRKTLTRKNTCWIKESYTNATPGLAGNICWWFRLLCVRLKSTSIMIPRPVVIMSVRRPWRGSNSVSTGPT